MLGAPIVLDAQLLVVVLPRIQSEQGPSHIERIRVDQRGIAERKTVLDANAIVPGAYINSWRNVHHPASGSGGEVVVALCHSGQCGGMGAADAGAKSTLVRTADNGVTWNVIATLDGVYWIVSWRASPVEVLLYQYPTDNADSRRPPRFVSWPSMKPVTPPSPIAGAVEEQQFPVFIAGGHVGWWWSGGRLVDEAGRVLLTLPSVATAAPARQLDLLPSPDGQRLVVTWITGEAREQRWYWTLFERNSDGTYAARPTISQPTLINAVPYSWLDDHRVMIPASAPSPALGLPAGYVPAILDLDTAEVRPLAAFAADPAIASRGNYVVGID